MEISLKEATEKLTAPGQMFEIVEEPIDGVLTRVWKNCPPSLRFVLEWAASYKDRVFMVFEDERITFSQFYSHTAAFAQVLAHSYGVKKGDRVAIAMRNLPEWVIAFFAAAAVGAVVVPLNAWWTGAELSYALEDSASSVLVADLERISRLKPHMDALGSGGLGHIVVARLQEGSDSASSAIPSEDQILLELLADGDASSRHPLSVQSFDDAVSLGKAQSDADPPGRLPDVDLFPDDYATIFYTSGTTGRPKGALGTQRNICTNLMSLGFVNARAALRATGKQRPVLTGEGAQNAYLLSVPLFHATGCHSILVANAFAGGKLVMMRRWNPERALELIEREKVTIFGGVPTMAWQVLSSADLEKRDTSSVRSIAYGGAPAPPELVRRIKQHFPTGQPSNGYGLTETSSVTTMITGDDYLAKPDSVGPAVPVCEVKVVGADDQELPSGQTGELWIKGPNVVRGYWNNPAATASTFTHGWLHTGDIARIDEDGFVYIVDRAKDMVIRGGENIYSAEVEAVLFEHPAVADAAVIGVPHPILGEEVAAVVVLRPRAAITDQELQDFLSERLAAFKVPSQIFFQEESLPRNPAGKVLKRELKEAILG